LDPGVTAEAKTIQKVSEKYTKDRSRKYTGLFRCLENSDGKIGDCNLKTKRRAKENPVGKPGKSNFPFLQTRTIANVLYGKIQEIFYD